MSDIFKLIKNQIAAAAKKAIDDTQSKVVNNGLHQDNSNLGPNPNVSLYGSADFIGSDPNNPVSLIMPLGAMFEAQERKLGSAPGVTKGTPIPTVVITPPQLHRRLNNHLMGKRQQQPHNFLLLLLLIHKS